MSEADPLRLAPFDGRPPRRLVVLAHGFGSAGNEMMPLAVAWAEKLPDTAFYAPDAPHRPEGEDGFCWAPRRSPRDGRMLSEIAEAAAVFETMCDAELARLGLDGSALALVGFSQGAVLSLYLGLRRAVQPLAVLAYGGGLVGRVRLAEEIRSRPPVLMVNGTADELAPASNLDDAMRVFDELGVPAEGVPLGGLAHGIDGRAVALGHRFLASAFAFADRRGAAGAWSSSPAS